MSSSSLCPRRNNTITPTSSSSSSSSSSSNHLLVTPRWDLLQAAMDEKEEPAISKDDEKDVSKKEEKEGGGGEDDEGYHTPTSPRHRIPRAITCPAPPRKPAPPVCRKRKARVERACRELGVEDEVDSFLSSAEIEVIGFLRSKKIVLAK